MRCHAEIWVYANNPGGITSASFTTSGNTYMMGQLSEWQNVSALDPTGSVGAAAGTSLVVPASAATIAADELAVTSYCEHESSGAVTFTANAPFTNLGNNGPTNTFDHYTADYALLVPRGLVSETQTSTTAADSWAGVLVTFR